MVDFLKMDKIFKTLRENSKLWLIVFLIFAVLLTGFAWTLENHKLISGGDVRILNAIESLRTPRVTAASIILTNLGKWQNVVLLMLVFVAFFLAKKKFQHLIVLIISVAGGEFLVFLFKNTIQRQRPPFSDALMFADGYSFPSGHSFVALSFYGLLAYFLFRGAGKKIFKFFAVMGAALFVSAIGFTRVYLGLHWPSDVFLSYALGIGWLTILIAILEIRKSK